ncbi:hypothetical protein H5410_008899 [Solanum commersonii]|uniref:Uncharacterized protein n=1 Tax=Solanum commersonii TaxID=4109 RepID=A0A9J6AGY5_SOLCO|nr:hypothetical protein H5410_008899 [Solanum commersonii]
MDTDIKTAKMKTLPPFSSINRLWASYLRGLQVVNSQVEASFMSKQATLYLGSVGLLGEYCPTSRKRCHHISDRVDCMHLDLFPEGHLELSGCTQTQLSLNKFWAKGSSGNP